MPTLTEFERNRPRAPNARGLPASPQVAASVGLPNGETHDSALLSRTTTGLTKDSLAVGSIAPDGIAAEDRAMQLELQDGQLYRGVSFGAEKSIAGELVFQTGMVGYPESVTDPSYRGQILVITFPLVGNYGVPSRVTEDELLKDLPAHFEAKQIHISGLVVASYSGEEYSHHLATSSLGTWLKEQGIPAMQGVDTRALTKRIREEGSMLGKMLIEEKPNINGIASGDTGSDYDRKEPIFESIDWHDPNTQNLVADGERIRCACSLLA